MKDIYINDKSLYIKEDEDYDNEDYIFNNYLVFIKENNEDNLMNNNKYLYDIVKNIYKEIGLL